MIDSGKETMTLCKAKDVNTFHRKEQSHRLFAEEEKLVLSAQHRKTNRN